MKAIFYYNYSDYRVVVKTLKFACEKDGIVVSDVGVMNPTLRFNSDTPINANYVYIPELIRYFSIKNINLYRKDVYDIELEEDVLMSFRRDILETVCIVDKQSDRNNGDEYIDDGSLVTENMRVPSVYNFPNGFNNSPEYILITGG